MMLLQLLLITHLKTFGEKKAEPYPLTCGSIMCIISTTNNKDPLIAHLTVEATEVMALRKSPLIDTSYI